MVYDLVDVGHRHRFMIHTAYGPVIVHNCTQALSADLTRDAFVKISARYPVVMLTHDEIMCEVPESEAKQCEAFMRETMERAPAWAKGLPVRVDGWIDQRFCKT